LQVVALIGPLWETIHGGFLTRGFMMDTQDVISTLNTLLVTTKDGEEGFRALAESVESPRLKTTFQTAALRCSEGAAELTTKIRGLGGDPSDSGSVGGAVHRVWTNVRSMVTGKDEHALLAEAERGQDAAKSAYQSALDQDLPADVRMLVQKQYQGVKENHDRVRQLRDAA
jgi:uncharacterized protein (TIGR02284 family)